ncbi:MAG: helix-turn-helix transcriptional regulator [Micrococcales bacterium]|nr:helix-turn-helix transcriptional regulator [Micrococcales bacterium]MCL2668997.1 helix-turn-helix transcriptional regulator [Micrococcales bacterium]
MNPQHDSYEQVARARRGTAEYREGYDEARRAFMLGQLVRQRRLEQELSQSELAARAGMTQPSLSRLEAGGTVPTIPVLDRLATALGAELVVTITPATAA